MTMPSGGQPAAIVLDFGREVGGTPYITVSAASSGSKTVRISTSEALQFLTNSGGAFVNDSGSQINLTVTGAQTYTGGLRGGFRFAAIELRTAGSITLTAAGLTFKAYRAGPAQYQGWFMSSDDQLNKMWYAGAYTTQMDMVPAGVASCFTQPVIFDGAKRDRAIWSGDLMITRNQRCALRQGFYRCHHESAGLQRPAHQRRRVPWLRRLRLRRNVLGLLGHPPDPALSVHR
jgi:hypothetical protein